MNASFISKLNTAMKVNSSLVSVGLDTDITKLPKESRIWKNPQLVFNQSIIDATGDLVCAFKPNSAFYEATDKHGLVALRETIDYVHKKFPHVPVILDAKRGDIGNTNAGYVASAFDYLGADAITLHPYLGREALQPFLDRVDKGCIILCRTSNPGAGEFQDLIIDGEPQYIRVARRVAEQWNVNGNCLLVVGATYPEQLARVREVIGDMPILAPGVGAQGGAVEAAVKNGINSVGRGLIVNSSRDIIFASSGPDFAKRAREKTEKLRDEINQYR